LAIITSSRFGIQYPDGTRTDRPDIPLHLANIVTLLDANGAMFGQGTFANRPTSSAGTPGKQGRFYMSTDGTGGQAGTNLLYYDLGTAWAQITSTYAGPPADSITSVELAPNSVTSVELADGSVDSAAIIDGTITAADLSSALKPSTGAGASTEALRSLGTGAGQALGYSDLSNSVFKSGTRALLPANSSANDGTWYFATDQEVMYYGAGGTWHRVGKESGDIVWTLETTARTGWMICTGQNWPATNGAYADLFAKWGGLYPTVLPDLQARMFIAKGTHADVNTLGFNDGLAVANRRPKHKHTKNGAASMTGANSSLVLSGSNSSLVLNGSNSTIGLSGANSSIVFNDPTHAHSVPSGGAVDSNFASGSTAIAQQVTSATDYRATGAYLSGSNSSLGLTGANSNLSLGGAQSSHSLTGAQSTIGVSDTITIGPQTGAEPLDCPPYFVLIPQVKL
jgi:Phage Tail Collar Domain